eukprot:1383356-Amphidinium_carterae.4
MNLVRDLSVAVPSVVSFDFVAEIGRKLTLLQEWSCRDRSYVDYWNSIRHQLDLSVDSLQETLLVESDVVGPFLSHWFSLKVFGWMLLELLSSRTSFVLVDNKSSWNNCWELLPLPLQRPMR